MIIIMIMAMMIVIVIIIYIIIIMLITSVRDARTHRTCARAWCMASRTRVLAQTLTHKPGASNT